MRTVFIKLVLLFTFFDYTSSYSQKKEIPDSILKMPFNKIESYLKDLTISKEIKFVLAEGYYKKAKQSKNIHHLATALYYKGRIPKIPKIAYKYIDSIIDLTKDTKDNVFPAKAYFMKSEFLIIENKLNECLDAILLGEKYAQKNKNIEQLYEAKKLIGLLEISLGNYHKAIKFFKSFQNFALTKGVSSKEYIHTISVLCDLHNRIKKPDSAIYYLNKLSHLSKENLLYKYIPLEYGICYHYKKDFKKSNSYLFSSLDLLKETDLPNLTVAYLYIAKNNLFAKNHITAKKYFLKVDSILQRTKRYTNDNKEAYIHLIELSKKEKNEKAQLFYLNKLLEIDESLNKNNTKLTNNVNVKYNTPHLLAEKQILINTIKRQKLTYQVLSILFVLILVIVIYYGNKTKREKKLYKERFESLMNQPKELPIIETVNKEKSNAFEISETTVKTILEKLSVFEKDKVYLEDTINLVDLAKQLDTNGTYLSKIINQYKQKNFNQYLNDLRIDYAINKLKEDKTFRKYTIKAIANEVGFSKPEAFSKSFFNKTGIQPSYFIKNLENLKE